MTSTSRQNRRRARGWNPGEDRGASAFAALSALAAIGAVTAVTAMTALEPGPASAGEDARSASAPGAARPPARQAGIRVAPASPSTLPSALPSAVPQSSQASPQAVAPASVLAAMPIPPSAAPDAGTASPGGPPRAETRRETFTLRQLGALGPLALRGTSELQGVQFGIRADEVVTAATLDLSGAMSPALIPEMSNVTVTMNEQYIGTIPVTKDQPRFEHLQMEVSPVLFQADNRLNFRFSGRYTPQCNDMLSGLLWSTVADASTLTLTVVRLPPQLDLAKLPLPFFDAHEKRPLVLPFVMTPAPNEAVLQAAGIVSSWFGQLADFRGASFPAAVDGLRPGNAVVLAMPGAMPPGVTLPTIDGPTIAVVGNPDDPSSSLLVVAGRTGAELVGAAQTLALGSRALGGSTAAVAAPSIADRTPYDAPAWIPTDRAVKFGELVSAADLEGVGYVPGAMHVPFRTAPDLQTWRGRAFPVEVLYRSPPSPIVDTTVSRLDMALNDRYLGSAKLSSGDGATLWPGSGGAAADGGAAHHRLDLPPYAVFGRNDLRFSFDARPHDRGECSPLPNDLHMAVSPDSTIDLSRAYHVATLPNLQFFVNSAFPFSRMADLSETAVVLPRQPASPEIGAYLDVMGRIGSLTGTPAARLTVAFPGETARVAGKDLLVIGALGHLGPAASLLDSSGLSLDHDAMTIRLNHTLAGIGRLFGDRTEDARRDAEAQIKAAPKGSMAALVGAESPLSSGRSLVALVSERPEGLDGLVASLRDGDGTAVQGDLSIRSGEVTTSYRVGPTYRVGSVPFWLYPAWFLADSPAGVLGLILVAALLLSYAAYRTLRRRARAHAA